MENDAQSCHICKKYAQMDREKNTEQYQRKQIRRKKIEDFEQNLKGEFRGMNIMEFVSCKRNLFVWIYGKIPQFRKAVASTLDYEDVRALRGSCKYMFRDFQLTKEWTSKSKMTVDLCKSSVRAAFEKGLKSNTIFSSEMYFVILEPDYQEVLDLYCERAGYSVRNLTLEMVYGSFTLRPLHRCFPYWKNLTSIAFVANELSFLKDCIDENLNIPSLKRLKLHSTCSLLSLKPWTSSNHDNFACLLQWFPALELLVLLPVKLFRFDDTVKSFYRLRCNLILNPDGKISEGKYSCTRLDENMPSIYNKKIQLSKLLKCLDARHRLKHKEMISDDDVMIVDY